MAQFTLQAPHNLGKDEALRRLKEKFHVVRNNFGGQVADLEERWDGDQFAFGFKAMGMRIAGQVVAGEADVAVTVELPFAALMFRGAIERQIRAELGELLN